MSSAAWSVQNQYISDEIAAHDFELREWRLLDFLRRHTYGAGRLAVVIEQLDVFAAAVDISRGNVSSILKKLKAKLVIEERPKCCYGFRLDGPDHEPTRNWLVPSRLKMFAIGQQLDLIQDEPHIRDILRVRFQEHTQGIPGRPPGSTYAGRTLSESALQAGVPDSGTPDISLGRSRFGNDTLSPPTVESSVPVPDSGTGYAYMQPCSTAPSKEHTNMATCPVVPESGTGRLDDYRQHVLDRVRALGAFSDHADDNNRSTWLGMVRKRPRTTDRLAGECGHAMRVRRISNPGGWMMDQWKRWGRPND